MTPDDIKALIYKKGANLSDVARAAGVAPSTVSRVINGGAKSREIATVISNFLGKPVETLWPGKYPDIYRRRSSEQVLMELRAAAANISRHAEAA